MLCGGSECRSDLPSPTDHLSEASRKHFEGVLEYLEATDTPYELKSDLLSRGTAWTETCFEVRSDSRIAAWGSRYQDLAKHFFKQSLPSIGAVIRITHDERMEMPTMKERSGTRFVFVHIGEEAKRESMKMTDVIRKAKLPLTQTIGIESLTEQMHYVERINPPYLLIMGRKEALERSVILRNRSTYSETSIPLDSLIDRLRAVA
jgi:histidyl-tRNA synthetase